MGGCQVKFRPSLVQLYIDGNDAVLQEVMGCFQSRAGKKSLHLQQLQLKQNVSLA